MSLVKRMLEDEDGKQRTALSIALEAGVLEQCPAHEECIYEGGADIEDAYKLAAHEFKNGEHEEFRNQKELTDMIKDVVEDHCGSECGRCANQRDE